MSEMDEKAAERAHREEQRAAYMIAWRDRCIEKLRERVEGAEEEIALLLSLLFYALCHGAGAGTPSGSAGEQHSFSIDKKELSALMGAWRYTVENGEESYRVTFRPAVTGCDAGQTGSYVSTADQE